MYEVTPSLSRQKSYIIENESILDHNTKIAILGIVIMEVGPTTMANDEKISHPIILENQTTKEVSINLDNIDNVEVIRHIYNIVSNRRALLSEPANYTKHY